jgi:hypothetical protein
MSHPTVSEITAKFREAVQTAPLHPYAMLSRDLVLNNRTGTVSKIVKGKHSVTIRFHDGERQEFPVEALVNKYEMVGAPGRPVGWGEEKINFPCQQDKTLQCEKSFLDLTIAYIFSGVDISGAHAAPFNEWMSSVVPREFTSLTHYLLGVPENRTLVKKEEYSSSLVDAYKELIIVELVHTVWPHMFLESAVPSTLQPAAHLSSWLRNADKVKTQFPQLNSCYTSVVHSAQNALAKKSLITTILGLQVQESRNALSHAVASIQDGMAEIQKYGGEAFFVRGTPFSPQVSFFFLSFSH